MNRSSLVIGACALLAGCVVQGAPVGAWAFHQGVSRHNRAVWGGHLAAAYERGPIHFGVETEGRVERSTGSVVLIGIRGGLATASSSRVNVVGNLDVGIPVVTGVGDGWYLGGALTVPIRLSEHVPLGERNRNLRLLGSALELAPFLRVRAYHFDSAPDDDVFPEAAVGIALRAKYGTDLL